MKLAAAIAALLLAGCRTPEPPPTAGEQAIRDAVYLFTHQP